MKVPYELKLSTDICVVGGGIAGLTAALAAARKGSKVVLLHERPVLGGASSSENRVHVCGADRHNQIKNMRETGIIEELRLENLRRNPNKNYYIWDTILYEKVKAEKNISLFLNATVMDAKTKGKRITEATAWQMTTETFVTVKARVYIDCSGDGVLAPFTGALFTSGREARSVYNESLAPVKANKYTMGMTCLFQSHDTGKPVKFEAPAWAHKFTKETDIPRGLWAHKHIEMGYWWIEMGGMQDCIKEAEDIKHELLKVVYGMWDHIKNHCELKDKAKTWDLLWIQFFPTKRESRRYIAKHVLNENDVSAGGNFADKVAYGGWTMDDHDSGGFFGKSFKKKPTTFNKTPSPYGIPYRSLVSKNIENLMFAGRCAGCSHMAMSSTRVQATGGAMGHAAGLGASIAVKKRISPEAAGRLYIRELQQMLIADDCYIPGIRQRYSSLTMEPALTASSGEPEYLRDGWTRPIGINNHRWDCQEGDSAEYTLKKPALVRTATLIFNSALDMNVQLSHHQFDDQLSSPPPQLAKEFNVKALIGKKWVTVLSEKSNIRRMVRVSVGKKVKAVKVEIKKAWGGKKTGMYAFYLD